VYFLGGKGGRCIRLTTLPPSCAVVMKSGNLNFLQPCGPLQACNGTASTNLMKILPVGTELFHGDGPMDRLTDRQAGMMKLKAASRCFAKSEKKPIVDTSPNHTCLEYLAFQQKLLTAVFLKSRPTKTGVFLVVTQCWNTCIVFRVKQASLFSSWTA
jgi:hypothetical protein